MQPSILNLSVFYSFLILLMFEHNTIRPNNGTNCNCSVCNIKGWPVPTTKMKVYKINNLANATGQLHFQSRRPQSEQQRAFVFLKVLVRSRLATPLTPKANAVRLNLTKEPPSTRNQNSFRDSTPARGLKKKLS